MINPVPPYRMIYLISTGKSSRRDRQDLLSFINPDELALQRAIGVYETERNAKEATIDWRFTTQDARHKLLRFYPCLSNVD